MQLDAARSLGISVSQACERGLADEVRQARSAAWLSENRNALLAWNDWIDAHGIPYDEYRQL